MGASSAKRVYSTHDSTVEYSDRAREKGNARHRRVGQDVGGEVRESDAVSKQTNTICGSQAEEECCQHWRGDGARQQARGRCCCISFALRERASASSRDEERAQCACARRVSGAADRDQPCGLAVMDGWRPGAFRILGFWAAADEPQTGGARRGSLGEVHRFFRKPDTSERIWAEGVTAPRVILYFFWNAVSSPPRAVNKL